MLFITMMVIFGDAANTNDETNILKADMLNNEDAFNKAIEGRFALIKFFAPWCGHCVKMEDSFNKVADFFKNHEYLKDKVCIAKVDCTYDKNTEELCAKYEVQGYPTLNFFTPSSSPSAEENHTTTTGKTNYSPYNGLRKFEFMRDFVLEQHNKTLATQASKVKPDSTFARHPELDAFVMQFMAAPTAEERKKIATSLEARIPQLDVPKQAFYYVNVTKDILNDDNYNIDHQLDRLHGMFQETEGHFSPENLESLTAQINILKVFKKYDSTETEQHGEL
jgi:thiol-disulfide isomerase/thioredoxin